VLNADDAMLVRHAPGAKPDELPVPQAWFALEDAHPVLVEARARGGATCGVADGALWLAHGGARTSLGLVEDMPLALGGLATYNIANLAAAALAADGLGIAPATIASVLAGFGAGSGDNPGRLQRWRLGGANVLLDYAHNPDGLGGFLRVATALRAPDGRLGLVLGQAGNRPDEDLRALARTAAAFSPARIVLKDIEGFLRGRAPGEVPAVLEQALRATGQPAASMETRLRELDAARALLEWARPGDVLALPIHALAARDTVVALLDSLAASDWRAGDALPAVGAAPGPLARVTPTA
jgi:cyanophycin synthetase